MDSSNHPGKGDSGPVHRVPREQLDMARTAAGLPLTRSCPSICPAVSALLVLAPAGARSACDHTAETGTTTQLRELRRQLGTGAMPLPHCRWCATWAAQGLLGLAPPLRDHGPLTGEGDGLRRLHTLVLRLPDGTGPDAEQLREVAAQTELRVLVLDARTWDQPTVAACLPLLHELPEHCAVELRGRHIADDVDLTALRPRHLELTLTAAAPEQIAGLAEAAAASAATARIRFVVTPASWFDFEDVARDAAAHELPCELLLLDRGGEVPVTALDVDDLHLLTEIVVAAWPRCGSHVRPSSLGQHAFDDFVHELRALLHVRVETVDADTSAPAHLGLPPTTHPWFTDPERRTWWLELLYGHAHECAVRDWLTQSSSSPAPGAQWSDEAWSRLLVQRVAVEQRTPELLQALREHYGDRARREALLADDAEFGSSFDVRRFGGPWDTALGLGKRPPRRRPFEIGPARPAKGPADVTVLIPSYRHEAYIEETLRSVLAQSHVALRVLVADDRSPDDTVGAARRVQDPRLDVRVNDENLGLGNSVLRALESVDTPYVALLNSDDVFHPERLERCLAELERDPSVQLVTTGICLVDSEGGEITADDVSLVLDGKLVYDWVQWYRGASPKTSLAPQQLFGALLERNFLVTSSNLVARTDWLRAQADGLRRLKYCLDWQLFLEAALEGALLHIPEPLIAYRLHTSNTVWFRDGQRWSYFLEVNRVAAEALQRFVARAPHDDDHSLERALEAIALHLTANTETNGMALFVNTLLDPLQLDRCAATRPHVQLLVELLNRQAAHLRSLAGQVPAANDDDNAEQLALRAKIRADRAASQQARAARLESQVLTLGDQVLDLSEQVQTLETAKRELYADQRQRIARQQELEEQIAALYRDQAARIAGQKEHEAELARLYEDQKQSIAHTEQLDRKLTELYADQRQRIAHTERLDRTLTELYEDQRQRIAHTERLDRTLTELYEDQRQRIAAAEQLQQQLAELYEDQRQRIAAAEQADRKLVALYDDQRERIAHAARLDAELGTFKSALEQERELGQRLAADLDAVRKAHDTARSEAARLDAQLAAARADLTATAQRVADREAELTVARTAIAAEKAQVSELTDAKTQLEQQRSELLHRTAQLQDEIQRLLGTREYRTGNLIWNKLPLGYMSRRGKKWYRRILDAKDRAKMWFQRGRKAEGTAVVAACWQWPIYSHTFVYQEMVSLNNTGLDVRLFHWDLADTDQLHAAFRQLFDNRTQLQPIWENHQKDRDYFEKAYPGRLRSFLERIAPLCGKTVEELENESIVMQGCTFARMAELAGAKYIHSYFFYDQSFMAMQAAWLLDLPRGVSCYADHMMNDYPWKFVPLHVELCDVIVATSARIKRELSQLSGGRFDDKIIVKPNGVDGERFPPRKRPTRQVDEPFEVLSVSRIEPKKGLTHLVEAIAMLKEKGHKVIAHVIGSKDPHSKGSLEYAAEFEDCIARHGLQDQVILHGMMKQEQMPPIIEQCRAFVAPYVETESGDKDGIPTAMLEALASSLPVVTTDSGSILEVIDNGVEGLVVPQRDSKAYAAALEKLITDPALEQRMAKAARARFDRDFDIKVTEKRLHQRIAGFLAAKAKA
ncbi:MAG: glycosyltransferase [Planctomycetota bacterium]